MEYYSVRFNLFANSYVGSEIAKTIRENYYKNVLINPQNYSNTMHAIKELANVLDINAKNLIKFIMLKEIDSKPLPPGRIFMASIYTPITLEGAYIKIDENMTAKDILRYANLAKKSLRGHDNDGEPVIKGNKRKQIGENEEIKKRYYLRIEDTVKKLAEQKGKKLINGSQEYEKYGIFIGESIKRVAGDILTEEYLDKEFTDKEFDIEIENKRQQLETWYYEITTRYSLPTPKQLQELLGLISN